MYKIHIVTWASTFTGNDFTDVVRFVRFVYGPSYVTANVGPVTLCDSPGAPVWLYVLVSPVSCYRVLKHVALHTSDVG